jgi:hypothetical protein
LVRKAGVPPHGLAQIIVKELTDNGLDAAGDCDVRLEDGVVVVENPGRGIAGDDAEIADLFSIARPQRSSKFIRLPTRGALGNGLRIVAGAVLATGGELIVSTSRRTLRIKPDAHTGRSAAERVGPYDGAGTRIELRLGDPLEPKSDDLLASDIGITAALAQEKRYTGKTSSHWYDAESFLELLRSNPPEVTVRDFIADFEGCSGSGSLIAARIAEGFERRPAFSLNREEATEVLRRAKGASRAVAPERLGWIGRDAFGGSYKRQGHVANYKNGAQIPQVVEVWAEPCDEPECVIMVNGSVTTTNADAWYSKKERMMIVSAAGLRLELKSGKTGMLIHINIITPYMPVTSDGKAPALHLFERYIEPTVQKAVSAARRSVKAESPSVSLKAFVYEHLEEQKNIVSGNRKTRFNYRQCWYKLRPLARDELHADLTWKYFEGIITDYEKQHGEDPMGYRDPRGALYVPHSGEVLPVGTFMVEAYKRPEWRFNKLLFIEKEGFTEALKADGFLERHDCAILASKGQPTRAARDLIDLIGVTDEPVQVFAIHDCDAAGTIILQTLREETAVRPARKVEVVNLGLDVEEVLELEEAGVVDIENIKQKERLSVADYAAEHSQWFQEHRCELNAFTMPQFISWLDQKMEQHGAGKLIPPVDVVANEFDSKLREIVHDQEVGRVLAEADIDGRVDRELERIKAQTNGKPEVLDRVREALAADPHHAWDAVVEALATDAVESCR